MIINGKAIGLQIRQKIKAKIAKMAIKPGLAVVLVGNNFASKIYVKAKEKACQKAGFYFKKIALPASIKQKKLLTVINKLNQNLAIHAILVQLPLPSHLNENKIINSIDPKKDVDCFHPLNIGNLSLRKKINSVDNLLASCTAKGIIKLIKSTGFQIKGKKAVVVGRSNSVGKQVSLLLLAKDATVVICHSKTISLKKETKQADILIAAAGKPYLINKEMVKKGALVIDVGINRTKKGLIGDVDFNEVKKVASFITPVPGGVGPMTIACLLENTLLLAKRQLK